MAAILSWHQCSNELVIVDHLLSCPSTDLDVYFGLPDSVAVRAARFYPLEILSLELLSATRYWESVWAFLTDKSSLTHRSIMNPARMMDVSFIEIWFSIDLIHKSHNAPVPYLTMLHSEQKCAHFCSEWSIVRYGTSAFYRICEIYLLCYEYFACPIRDIFYLRLPFVFFLLLIFVSLQSPFHNWRKEWKILL